MSVDFVCPILRILGFCPHRTNHRYVEFVLVHPSAFLGMIL